MAAHTVASLADLVGGVLFGPGGDREVRGVADLRNAAGHELSFLANRRYESLALASQAAAILVHRNEAGRFSFTRIAVDSPSLAFGHICQLFAAPRAEPAPGLHPTAVVAPDASLGPEVSLQPHAVISAGVRLGARCHIGANSFIGAGSVLGDDCWVHPLVTIRERSQLGARVIIHSGAVIGADGFGYELQEGRHVKIEHTGYVQIDADVEIGANTTIDRGRFGATRIGTGVKIDNLVQIAHNVTIGPHSIIVAQTGISGSTSLGRYVTLAGQVGLAGHLSVGDRAVVTAQSGVTKDVPPGAVLSGRHAWPLRECLRVEALLRRLPEVFSRLKKLESSDR